MNQTKHCYCDGNILQTLFVTHKTSRPKYLIVQLDIKSGQISRVIFNSSPSYENMCFASSCTSDCEGRVRLLKVEIDNKGVLFQLTTIHKRFVFSYKIAY